MRKTRRSLYSRRRRLRGKGLGKALCAGALIAAISMVPAAAAREPTFYELAQKYATEGGWENSHNLAKYITDMNWATPENLYPEACTIPAGIDAEKVLEPYLLSPGVRVKIAEKDGYGKYDYLPQRPFARGTFVRQEDGDAYLKEYPEDDVNDGKVRVPGYFIKEHEEDGEDMIMFFPEDAVTLEKPMVGARRKQRRKTLRRKK